MGTENADKRTSRGRSKRLFPESDLLNSLSTTCSYPQKMLPEALEEENRLDKEFPLEYSEVFDLWQTMDTLLRIIIEKRAALADSSNHRAAVDLLAAKAIGDARGAYLLLRHGYSLASLGPLRAALEAVDLMAYFRLHPEEVEAWRREDKKFDSLGWIRKELLEDPTPLYDFFAYGMHANWRFIPQLLSSGPTGARNFEIVPGPVRTNYLEVLALASTNHALRAIAELHRHHPEVVSQAWCDQYNDCTNKSQQILMRVSGEAKAKLENYTLRSEDKESPAAP